MTESISHIPHTPEPESGPQHLFDRPDGYREDVRYKQTDTDHIRAEIAEQCYEHLWNLLGTYTTLRIYDREDYDILRGAVGMKAQEVISKHEITTGSAGQIVQLESVICLKSEETGDVIILPEDSVIQGTIDDIWAGDPVADSDDSSQLIEPLLVLTNIRLPKGSLSTGKAPLPENGTYFVSLAHDYIHMSFLDPIVRDEEPDKDGFTQQPHAL